MYPGKAPAVHAIQLHLAHVQASEAFAYGAWCSQACMPIHTHNTHTCSLLTAIPQVASKRLCADTCSVCICVKLCPCGCASAGCRHSPQSRDCLVAAKLQKMCQALRQAHATLLSCRLPATHLPLGCTEGSGRLTPGLSLQAPAAKSPESGKTAMHFLNLNTIPALLQLALMNS